MTVYLLTFFDCVVLAPILVTTLFPDDTSCCRSGRNAKHIALTSRQHSQWSQVAPLRVLLTWSHVFFRSFLEEPSRKSCPGTNEDRQGEAPLQSSPEP